MTKWHVLYDEEFPLQDACAGVLTNNIDALFYAIVCTEYNPEITPLDKYTVRIYNSILLTNESMECEFRNTDKNKDLFLSTLDNSKFEECTGENSVLRQIKFEE